MAISKWFKIGWRPKNTRIKVRENLAFVVRFYRSCSSINKKCFRKKEKRNLDLCIMNLARYWHLWKMNKKKYLSHTYKVRIYKGKASWKRYLCLYMKHVLEEIKNTIQAQNLEPSGPIGATILLLKYMGLRFVNQTILRKDFVTSELK